MNTSGIDLTNVDELVRTVDDPHSHLNVQIVNWVRTGDLVIGGKNVAEALASHAIGTDGVAVDAEGRIAVADTLNHRIVLLNPNGSQLGIITNPSMDDPESVAFGPDGKLYVHQGIGNLGTHSIADTARPAAEVLGLNWNQVEIVWGDTSRRLPRSSVQAGSQTTHAHTRANHAAGMDALRKVREIASRTLGGAGTDAAVGMIVVQLLANGILQQMVQPIAYGAALGIHPDAALLAVLIGSSCDFLTPIGHQNNLIVMRPGNYRFRDYPKVGLPLSILAILITAYVLSRAYG